MDGHMDAAGMTGTKGTAASGDPDRRSGARKSGKAGSERPVRLLRFLPLALILLGLAAVFLSGLHHYLSWEALRENRQALTAFVEANRSLAALAFVLTYTLAAALSIPGAIFLTIGAGFLFGLWPGAPLAVAGGTLGAVAIFLAARTALGDVLERHLGHRFRRLEKGFRENAFSYMLFLRLMPIFPFWFVNLAPAFLGVPLRTFALGTLIGVIPGGLVYVSIGNGLGAILDAGGTPDPGLLTQPHILLPILGLAALSLVPVLYKHWAARRS